MLFCGVSSLAARKDLAPIVQKSLQHHGVFIVDSCDLVDGQEANLLAALAATEFSAIGPHVLVSSQCGWSTAILS